MAPPDTAIAPATTTRWVVALTAIGSLMAALDTLVVSTALTTIRTDLHASVQQLEWTVNAYNLAFAVLLISAAALGDRYGRRTVYAVGLLVFAAASAGCALAPGAGTLIAARAVQGAGAALILPVGLALLSEAFPPEKRGAAIGIFSAITGLSVASGPLVGGAVVQGLSWHWIFWLNVPIGLAAAPLALRMLRQTYGPAAKVDLGGLLLVSAGSFGCVWGLVRGNDRGWSSPEVVASLALGVGLLVGFVDWQHRSPSPMLPPALFRSRAFAAGNAAIFFTFASLFTGVFFFAQLLQVVLREDALQAGIRLIPWTVTFLTVAPAAGALADRIGERWLLTVGLLLQAAGMLWLVARTGSDVSYSQLWGPFVLAGVGVSMAIPCAQNSVLRVVGSESIGSAAGVNSMMRELGGVFGIAVTVAVFSGNGDTGSATAFLDGFRPAIAVGACLALLGAGCGVLLPSRTAAPVAAEPVVGLAV